MSEKLFKTLTAIAALALSNPVSAKIFTLDNAISAFEATKKAVESSGTEFNSTPKNTNIKTISIPDGKGLPPFNEFYSSKKEIAKHLYKNPYTFYANCKIEFSGRGKFHPDLRSCNYESRGNPTRARRIEFEHIFPVSWAKKQFGCWDNGGRENCRKTDAAFRVLEADPVNLVPSVGEINGDRSNYRYAELNRGFDYGTNGRIYYSKEERKFMPPHDKKGWVARVHLYMVKTYDIELSSSYEKLMNVWAKLPASQEECEYNRLTTSWGYNNPLTSQICN
ncbi:endonuclease [Vibrio vulnificus]|nr:endonuclease [Vibrio vulnificus]